MQVDRNVPITMRHGVVLKADVGMSGRAYAGATQWLAATERPPHLKIKSEQPIFHDPARPSHIVLPVVPD